MLALFGSQRHNVKTFKATERVMASFRKSHHIFFLPLVEAAEVIIITCVFSAANKWKKNYLKIWRKKKSRFYF